MKNQGNPVNQPPNDKEISRFHIAWIAHLACICSRNRPGASESRELPPVAAVSLAPGKARRETPAFSSPRQGLRRKYLGFLWIPQRSNRRSSGCTRDNRADNGVEMLGEDALYRKSSVIARIVCLKEDGLPGIASSILQIQAGYQRLWVQDTGLTGRFAISGSY